MGERRSVRPDRPGCARRLIRVEFVDTTESPPAAPPTLAGRLTSQLRAAAPLLLLLSVAARLAWTYLLPNGANFVDLHVYVGAGASLNHPDTLYNFVYADQTPDFALPFIYPPFAALVAYPLHLVPFGVLAFCWQLGTIAALYAVVRCSQHLLETTEGPDFAQRAGPGDRRAAALWTAAAIWTEPVRSTLDYGQVNVVLVLAVLWAVRSTRWWLSGLLVGVAAGVKLTPAIGGLYFVGRRRWAAAAFAAAVFCGTVVVSALVVGDQVRHYFRELLVDTGRIPIGTSFNQSLRGALSRILGYDAGHGPLMVAAIVVTAVLAVLAWRAVEASDRLGSVLIVSLWGLLISPISWTHHWVWLVPLMIWLLHGPRRTTPGARILGWGWLVLTLIGVPWLLGFAQPTIWQISRPWYLAWAGLVYPLATAATLGWIAATRQSRRSHRPTGNPCP